MSHHERQDPLPANAKTKDPEGQTGASFEQRDALLQEAQSGRTQSAEGADSGPLPDLKSLGLKLGNAGVPRGRREGRVRREGMERWSRKGDGDRKCWRRRDGEGERQTDGLERKMSEIWGEEGRGGRKGKVEARCIMERSHR